MKKRFLRQNGHPRISHKSSIIRYIRYFGDLTVSSDRVFDAGWDKTKYVKFTILINSDYTDYIINIGPNPSLAGSLNIDFARKLNLKKDSDL